ncbi:MAG: hypothetical protein E6K14_00620 [Methanobacteriota archaeon]|nr:MAG: hypothetical protein E6K14_00620 [Euryarchaeota archaeon]
MRLVLVVFGILFLLGGLVWALQGLGILQGSFMSNNPTWVWIGGITAIAGLGIAVLGLTTKAATKKA